MSQSESREVENLRSRVFTDPVAVLEIGQGLMTELGVTASFVDQPELYIAQARMTDPRYVNSKGEQRNISRQAVTEKAHTMTDDMLVHGVMHTAENLGILTPTYPFDDFAAGAEEVRVTGGTIGALRDRTEFAITSLSDVAIPIVVVGGDRATQEAEARLLEKEGKDPSLFPSEKELAELTVAEMRTKYPKHTISSYAIRTTNPQNIDTIRETFLSNPKLGRLALITTGLYVPFTTMDASAVITELGEKVQARVYAGESSAAAVAARKVDTYRSEVVRTLVGAARWHMAQSIRRR